MMNIKPSRPLIFNRLVVTLSFALSFLYLNQVVSNALPNTDLNWTHYVWNAFRASGITMIILLMWSTYWPNKIDSTSIRHVSKTASHWMMIFIASVALVAAEMGMRSHHVLEIHTNNDVYVFLSILYLGAFAWSLILNDYTNNKQHRSKTTLSFTHGNGRIYWVGQCLGWGIATLQWTLLIAITPNIGVSTYQIFSWSLTLCLGSFSVSHFILRPFLHRMLNTQQHPIIKIIRTGLLCLCSLLLVLYIEFLWVSVHPPQQKPLSVSVLITLFLMKLSGLLLWCLIYGFWLTWFSKFQADQHHIETERKLEKAQLKLLQQQLNPHFLFNTLNSLRAMIIRNPDMARDMVSIIANLLRFTLYRSSDERVTVRDEIDNAKGYCSLQKIRYGDRLSIIWNIDTSALSEKILPISLQCLIENAIKHGFNTYVNESTTVNDHLRKDHNSLNLTVDIYKEHHSILILVKNNGTLIIPTPSQQPSGTPQQKITGIGLSNIRERLFLFFGNRASFEIKQADEQNVLATIIQPITH